MRQFALAATAVAFTWLVPAFGIGDARAQTLLDTVGFIWSGIEDGHTSLSANVKSEPVCFDKWKRVGSGEFEAVEEGCDATQVDDSRFLKLKVVELSKCKFLIQDEGIAYSVATARSPKRSDRYVDKIILDFNNVRPLQSIAGHSGIGTALVLKGSNVMCAGAVCNGTKCITPTGCNDVMSVRAFTRDQAEVDRWKNAVEHLRKTHCPGRAY